MVIDRRHRAAIALLAATLAVSAPALIRNYQVNGAMWPTRNGENLYFGNSADAVALLPKYSIELVDGDALLERERPGILARTDPAAPREIDEIYSAAAVRRMTSQPAEVMWLVLRKGAYFFWPRLVPSQIAGADSYVVRDARGRIQSVVGTRQRPLGDEIAYSVSYVSIALAALVGLWVRGRDLRRDAVLGCIVLTFLTIHTVYFPATRYRTPMEFILLFYAAIGLDWWIRARRDGIRSSAGPNERVGLGAS